MRFALVNNKRFEAKPGLKGICPGCMQPVIAKCGNQKVHHWAHKANRSCDSWWEPETEWHRSWKNHFPDEWQEKIFTDQTTRENHIADVCTEYDLVIEFQHSHIKPEERISRENFYQNMLWIVDGTRLKYDYKRFLDGQELWGCINQEFSCYYMPLDCFPKDWIQSPVPVIFDFQGLDIITDMDDDRNFLYCLFPQRMGWNIGILKISHENFVELTINGEWLSFIKPMMETLNLKQQEWIKQEKRTQERIAFENKIKQERSDRFWRTGRL